VFYNQSVEKNMLSKIFSKAALPAWAGIVIAVLSLAYTLFMGGSTTQTFEGKNGAAYEVKLVIPDGVLELIEKCDLKKVGDECPVAVSLNVKMTKAPTVAEPVKPVEAPKVVEPTPTVAVAPIITPTPAPTVTVPVVAVPDIKPTPAPATAPK